MKSTQQKWQVMPDPEHAGKHPYHDNRFIATEGARWEDYSGDEPGETCWSLEDGGIICKMMDVTNQAEVAKLIAAAPDLLEALEYIAGCNPNGWSAAMVRDMAKAAIAKAKGES